MNKKVKLKISIDFVMTLLLLCLMAYFHTGQQLHEILGTAMFVLFLFHHILNRNWWKNIAKGKYSGYRLLQTMLDFALLIDMLLLMYSGIRMSGYVFTWLPVSGGMMLARRMHMVASYLGFVLMSFHMGLHWNMVLSIIRRHFPSDRSGKITIWIMRILTWGIMLYGCLQFVQMHIWQYITLQNEFVFFDASETAFLFVIRYVSMWATFLGLSYYLGKLLLSLHKRQ